MSKRRVQLFGQARGVEIDTAATAGAVVGRSLFLEDGTVVTVDMILNVEEDGDGLGAVYWRTIQERPPNVDALAAQEGTGLYVITGPGASETREISSSTLSVQNGNGVASDPAIDLDELEDSGSGALMAIERDQYGRVAGTKDATITGVEGEVTVEHGDAVGGLPTVGLADVPDEGGGTLQRIQRDAKGRVSGTSDATTDDLPEGSNLYFTDERARTAAVTDEIDPLATDTAPSGDAVADALAGKLSADGSVIATGSLLNSTSDFRVGPNTADGSDTSRTAIMGGGRTSRGRGGFVVAFGNEHPAQPGNVQIVAGLAGDVYLLGGAIRPQNDGAVPLGLGAARYSEVFAVNGAINTSDAREKTEPRDLTEAEIAAAADIARLPCIFQWLHAIEEKGEDARLHASPTVQSVIAAMGAHGLDPFRYGFVCFDEWDEQPEVKDEETGEVTQEHRPAGDRYSLRPSELAHFVMRGLAHRQDELERRLVALEG